ncbi:MAG: type II toxin-antitoxin system RelE/ParE family toxin [Planctomycetota bacterium]|nr:MAG: type II toxin-antitoxin system RelE/ParE family toxin [Planctomycetota bacterium]
MIRSFGDPATEDVFHGRVTGRVRRIPVEVRRIAVRKLDMLNAAQELRDLRVPPGNRLEALAGDLQGFHSVRVNDQWRLVFRWRGTDAEDVRLTDYHRG